MKWSIEPLTADLCNTLRIEAMMSMYGDQTCDIGNIHTSCFASEACAYKFHPSELDILLHSSHAFVVTTEIHGRIAFCACVAADKCCHGIPEFSSVHANATALFVHTLCVDEKYRKHGIASALLAFLKRFGCDLYLTVATGEHTNHQNFFKARSENLCKFYTKHDFTILCRNDRKLLLVYKV